MPRRYREHWGTRFTVEQAAALEAVRRPGETNSQLLLRLAGAAVGQDWGPAPRGFAAMRAATARKIRAASHQRKAE